MATYSDLTDANVLIESGKECTKNVSWKQSVQAFYLDRINRVRIAKERLEKMDRMSDGFVVFETNDKGKMRTIRSVCIDERMVQKACSNELLLPKIRPMLIYDNYASLEGRGVSMAFDRLKVNLQRAYRKYGTCDFPILVADLHAYFDSIDHDVVFEKCKKFFENDSKGLYLLMDFVDAFGEKSLGLGSQVSQALAVFYPNDIDHYVKEQLCIKYYGRYMDDFYLIDEDKEYLQFCLGEVQKMYADIGIEMNVNKTQIRRASTGFKFLKTKVHMTPTGKVVMRPDKAAIAREKRKIRKLGEKVANGSATFDDALQQYKSWRGYMEQFDSYTTLHNMDKYFDKVFIYDWMMSEYEEKQEKHEGGYYHVKFGKRQDPARRRHFVDGSVEWHRIRE